MAYFGFTNKLIKGETIKIFNYGNCKRDFTYIDDIVEGIVRVMQKLRIVPQGMMGFPYRHMPCTTLVMVILRIYWIS